MLDILFVIGLPRSGTSLVHNLVHKTTGRRAPTFESFGIDVSRVPDSVRKLNPCFNDGTSLAEDNDFPGWPDLKAYRKWLERRTGTGRIGGQSAIYPEGWVLKSPEHLGQLPELMDTFPEARFLWCLRPAGATLASIREYSQVLGVGPSYDVVRAVQGGEYLACNFPEKFDCIWTPSIPEFEAAREPILSVEQGLIDVLYQEVRGTCRNVNSDRFTEYYS